MFFWKTEAMIFYRDNDDQKYPLRDAAKIKFQVLEAFSKGLVVSSVTSFSFKIMK